MAGNDLPLTDIVIPQATHSVVSSLSQPIYLSSNNAGASWDQGEGIGRRNQLGDEVGQVVIVGLTQ